MTCQPDSDIGFDIVTISGGKFSRVQVKTTAGRNKNGSSYRFYTRRGGTNPYYTEQDADVFVFVAIDSRSFWIVPSSEMKLESSWYTARFDSQWKDAWHVLM